MDMPAHVRWAYENDPEAYRAMSEKGRRKVRENRLKARQEQSIATDANEARDLDEILRSESSRLESSGEMIIPPEEGAVDMPMESFAELIRETVLAVDARLAKPIRKSRRSRQVFPSDERGQYLLPISPSGKRAIQRAA